MKNFEKCIDELLEHKIVGCRIYRTRTCCERCNGNCGRCKEENKKWLLEDFDDKFIVTRLEYEILLKCKGYLIWRGIDEHSYRCLYGNIASKIIYHCFDDEFKILTLGKSYKADYILAHCEVVDDAD